MNLNEAIGGTHFSPHVLKMEVRDYIHAAPVPELLTYIAAVPNTSLGFTFARSCLDVRLAEEAAASANKIIQHTDTLTKQTEIHIENSKMLTQQTEKLVAESVGLGKLTAKLYWLTWALGAFAVIQIIIMVFDYIKHK